MDTGSVNLSGGPILICQSVLYCMELSALCFKRINASVQQELPSSFYFEKGKGDSL